MPSKLELFLRACYSAHFDLQPCGLWRRRLVRYNGMTERSLGPNMQAVPFDTDYMRESGWGMDGSFLMHSLPLWAAGAMWHHVSEAQAKDLLDRFTPIVREELPIWPGK